MPLKIKIISKPTLIEAFRIKAILKKPTNPALLEIWENKREKYYNSRSHSILWPLLLENDLEVLVSADPPHYCEITPDDLIFYNVKWDDYRVFNKELLKQSSVVKENDEEFLLIRERPR